jgi:hypothetical protein
LHMGVSVCMRRVGTRMRYYEKRGGFA